MTSGVFPDKLKHAKVTPVYKNGDKMLLSNSRPISVLSVFSNFLKKSMPRGWIIFLQKIIFCIIINLDLDLPTPHP